MSLNKSFSPLSMEQLIKDFPNLSNENPKFNFKIFITLHVDFNKKNIEQEVSVTRSVDIIDTCCKSIAFISDMWLEDILPNDDDISINDIMYATFYIEGFDTVYKANIDFKSIVY